MKRLSLVIALFFLCGVNGLYSQSVSETKANKFKISKSSQIKDSIFLTPEKFPQYPGGMVEMRKYIVKNLKWTYNDCSDIQGTVYLRFVVTETGKVGKVEILRGVDTLFDKEAVRVVKTLPDFKPGEFKGKKVKTWLTIPIRILIN